MPVEPGSQLATLVEVQLAPGDTEEHLYLPTNLCRGGDRCSRALNGGGRPQCQAGGGMKRVG